MAKSLYRGGKSVKINLHIFVEELSAKKVLDVLVPKVIPQNVKFQVYPHQGKQDLENAFKKTIPSISKIPGARILILRDQDSGDCKKIKKGIEEIIRDNCHAPVLIRIVCRELESWFLGDLNAVAKAYKRLKPKNYTTKSEFRNVDLIQNANKLLLSIIPDYKDYEHLPKLEVAESVAPHLDIESNSSASFNHFISAVRRLLN